jgi:Mrp family chromosome partitioning ATPase
MHKPGWRSRRRSRLSLVERAVPRLGRPPGPDDAPHAPRKEEPASQAASTEGTIAATRTALPPSPPADPIEAAVQPIENETMTASAALARAAEAVQAEERRDAAAVAHEEAVAESAVGSSAADDADESDSKGETRAVAAKPDGVESAGEGRAIAGSAWAAAGPGGEARIVEPDLRLNWSALIAGGFVDPRDRSRPLPRNMDEIARALVRQSLSDQSSWRDRIILVTSPHEREAKTVSAINFAFALTTVNRHKVVLLDADSGGSAAADRLGCEDAVGVTAALADESIEIDALAVSTDLDRLTLIASGDHEDDALDRFASRRMLQILRHFTRDPETLLVIDAPPMLASKEAAVLSVIAGQVVMAIEAGRTTADSIEHALQRIGDRHNVSLVLNENSGLRPKAPARGGKAGRAKGVGRDKGRAKVKPRAPKAAAAAALAIGLLAAPSLGEAGPSVERSSPKAVATALQAGC